MARRSGLGRGLGALIPPEAAGTAHSGALREVTVSSVRPNPLQPRKHFDEESLASLAASVRELGVLQPVLVRDLGEGAEAPTESASACHRSPPWPARGRRWPHAKTDRT